MLLVQAGGGPSQRKGALHVHRIARLQQPVELPQRILPAPVEHGAAQRSQRRGMLAQAEAQHMHLAPACEIVGAHLYAAHHLHAQTLPRRARLVQTAGGVVVGEGNAPNVAPDGLPQHFLERVRPVRQRGVHVKVLPHAKTPSCMLNS